MNIRRKARGGFGHLPDDDLYVLGNAVLQAITGNIHFPDPDPGLDILSHLLLDYKEKLAACRHTGGRQDTAAKNAARAVLSNQMRRLALYVTEAAQGDPEQLLSSGFELSRYPQPVPIPDMVSGVLLRDGKESGQIRLDFTMQSRVLFYEYRYAVKQHDQPLAWSEAVMTTASRGNILKSLQPFLRHHVQVRAVNRSGRSDWSEAVSFVPR